MDLFNLIPNFFAGFFICYAIPHLGAGLMGIPYRNLFGQGHPRVNFILGTLSVFIGGYLLEAFRFPFNVNISSLFFWLAFVLTGLWLSGKRST